MKKGFTLLELIVVVIILGVLATLGIMHYFRAVEKSRSAEAKQVIGVIRERAGAFFTVHETLNDGGSVVFDEDVAGITGPPDGIPVPVTCAPSHWFGYSITTNSAAPATISIMASRCTTAGKSPPFGPGGTVKLDTNFNLGTDQWTSSPVYQ